MDIQRLEQLEAALRQGPFDQRKAALDELAQSPSDAAVPVLQRLTLSSDFLCRRFAVMALSRHRTPAAFATLTGLLDRETDNNVIAEIADALFEFGSEAIPILQQLFLRNSHWLTRQTILSVLMEAEQDQVLLDVIQAALADQTQTVREAAIPALAVVLQGELAPQARQLLVQLQQDDNHRVAAAALELSLPPEP